MRAAIYIRVSTSHQVDKDSLPFQRSELTNYAKYVLNIDDVVIFEDAGFSGKNTSRPQYQRMMSRIRSREFSHLLVWKLDRISRNLRDFSDMHDELLKYGVTFVSKIEQFDTSTAMGEAMLNITAVFAQLERKMGSERVTAIALDRASRGLMNGQVPIGFRWNKELKKPVITEPEAKTVIKIFELYKQLTSCEKVAYHLNRDKVPTRFGGKWTGKTVLDILKNPFFIGTYRYNMKNGETGRVRDESEWIVIENNHEGLVDKDTFHEVNKIINANLRGNRKSSTKHENTHIFSQMLVCGKCGSTLTSSLDAARGDGYRPSRYTCSSRRYLGLDQSCSTYVSDVTLGPFVINYITNFLTLQDKIQAKHTLKDIQKILLRGVFFTDVACIEEESLNSIRNTFFKTIEAVDKVRFSKSDNVVPSGDSERARLLKDKQKFETAMSRLDDLFLFDESGMSKAVYLSKKQDIQVNLARIIDELSVVEAASTPGDVVDTSFLESVSSFILTKELTKSKNINFRELLDTGSIEEIDLFLDATIESIEIVDKKVYSIAFKNGIVHKFVYKDATQTTNYPSEKFYYRNFVDVVKNYLEDNSSISKRELMAITSLRADSASSLLRELMEERFVVKRGQSTSTRYYKAASSSDEFIKSNLEVDCEVVYDSLRGVEVFATSDVTALIGKSRETSRRIINKLIDRGIVVEVEYAKYKFTGKKASE